MARKEVHRVQQTSHHRNGIGGAPFGVVLFQPTNEPGRTFVGVVFEEKWHTAVFDVAKLAEGVIEFGVNSWRGDDFDGELRDALRATGNLPGAEDEADEWEEKDYEVRVIFPQTAVVQVTAYDEQTARDKALELINDESAVPAPRFESAKWEALDVEEVEG